MRNILVFIALFAAAPAATPASQSAYNPDWGSTEIIRDKWGVPHIVSDTDEGAFYGLGRAAAEDRAFQMVHNLRTIQGRLAEMMGEVKKTRRDDTTLDHDIKFRTMGFYRAAQKTVETLDPESRALLEAYSAGVNDWIAENPDKLIDLFDEYNVEPEPWTPADCIASWWNLARFFAGEGLHDLLVYNRIQSGNDPFRGGGPVVDDEAAVVQRGDVSDEWVAEVNAYVENMGLAAGANGEHGSPKFSHAWVVGGAKTGTGSAALCSDPQTPVRNPSLFYEFHIQGETIDARGVGVPGSPVILIGWNQNVAWGMTALGADQADLFILETDENRPNQYKFGGEWLDMEAREETIRVRGGEDRQLTVRETRFGPVVTRIAHGTGRGTEVALKRVPICDTDGETIQGALAMMRAENAEEFGAALAGWRFPSANCVFGDRGGAIGYWMASALPVRSPKALQGGAAAHDGSGPEFDWQGDVPHNLKPHAINPARGWIASGNHRAIQSFYPLGVLGLGTGSSGHTDRSWRLYQLMEDQERIPPEEVLSIHYDSTHAAKREIIRAAYHMRDNQKADLSPETLRALEYLEPWFESGAKSLMDRPGTELVNAIPTMFRVVTTPLTDLYGGGLSGLCLFLKSVKASLDKSDEARLLPAEQEFIDTTLASAWRAAAARYGDDPAEWNRRAREAVQREAMGRFETLDGFPALERDNAVNVPALQCVDGGTILSQRAQSYSQWVPLNDVDAARSILPFGQSENPDSPYYQSNYELWAKGEFHPAPLSMEALEPHIDTRETLNE